MLLQAKLSAPRLGRQGCWRKGAGEPCRYVVRAGQPETSQKLDQQQQTDSPVPIGCARYTVVLKRPLGVVLEEKGGLIRVVRWFSAPERGNGFHSPQVVDLRAPAAACCVAQAEVVPGSSAAQEGQVRVGDQLIATSGVTYNR